MNFPKFKIQKPKPLLIPRTDGLIGSINYPIIPWLFCYSGQPTASQVRTSTPAYLRFVLDFMLNNAELYSSHRSPSIFHPAPRYQDRSAASPRPPTTQRSTLHHHQLPAKSRSQHEQGVNRINFEFGINICTALNKRRAVSSCIEGYLT